MNMVLPCALGGASEDFDAAAALRNEHVVLKRGKLLVVLALGAPVILFGAGTEYLHDESGVRYLSGRPRLSLRLARARVSRSYGTSSTLSICCTATPFC